MEVTKKRFVPNWFNKAKANEFFQSSKVWQCCIICFKRLEHKSKEEKQKRCMGCLKKAVKVETLPPKQQILEEDDEYET